MQSLGYDDVMTRSLVLPTERASGPWFDILRGDSEIHWALSRLAGSDLDLSFFESIAGGCKGLDDQTRGGMFPYFAQAHGNPEDPDSCLACIRSGGTSDSDPMVTQVPGYLARLYKVLAFSTSPQTDRMSLNADTGAVELNKYGTGLDASQHSVGVVQRSASEFLDWDGDVRGYLDAFQAVSTQLEIPSVLGVVNGGGVTITEICGALLRNIPVILVDGTLRAADDFAQAKREGTFVDKVREHIGDEGTSFLLPEDVDTIAGLDLDSLVHVADFREPSTYAEGLSRFVRG